MFDSRSLHPRNAKHARRNDDTWLVKGVEVVHPSKPTLSKVEAIGEGVLDWLDIAEQANCLSDGLVIECEDLDWDAPWWRTPHRSESANYDVRTKNQRIMARIEASDRAKRERHYFSGQPAQYGSLIQVSTRRTRR